MATEFKRVVFSSVPAGTITGSGQKIYATPASTSGAVGALGNDDVYLIKGALVPVGSSLEVISGKVVVANTGSGTGDAIHVRCSAATSMDATISVLENT